MRKKVIADIKEKISLLNHIVTFIVFVLLFLIVRVLYYAWDFVMNPSIVATLLIIAFLSIIGLYLSNKISRQAVGEIEDYSNKLDNLTLNLTGILVDTIDTISPEKRGHSKMVAKYSLLMAHAINMSENDKKRLYTASLLHDIGFLKIFSRDIKSRDEYRTHCQIAHEMLKPINFYADIAPIVLHHHERYDGMGYPSGLKGEDIPIESRMIAIAEAFDVMVNRESYKYTGKIITGNKIPFIFGFYDAIEELKRNAGTQFDPQLVDIFINNVTPEHLQ